MTAPATMPYGRQPSDPAPAERYGVYYRRRPADEWLLVVHVGSREQAQKLLTRFGAENKIGGDYAAAPLNRPPGPLASDHTRGRPSAAGATTAR